MGAGFFYIRDMAKNKLEHLAEERKIYLDIKRQTSNDEMSTRDTVTLNMALDKATTLLLIARALEFAYGKGLHDCTVGGDMSTIDDLYDLFMEMPHDL